MQRVAGRFYGTERMNDKKAGETYWIQHWYISQGKTKPHPKFTHAVMN